MMLTGWRLESYGGRVRRGGRSRGEEGSASGEKHIVLQTGGTAMVAVRGPWAGLTAARVAPRIWPECSCSGRAPSSCRPLRCAAPRSLSRGSRRGWRSGSPSAAGHPATSWPPGCSSGAAPSTGRPVREKEGRGW